MKKIKSTIAIIIVTIIFALMAIGSGSDSSSTASGNYSDDYKNDKVYRDNVDDAADAWGTDSETIDRELHALEDFANNN